VGFIAGHAGRVSVDGLRWGVEPICRVLSEHGVPIAPSTYYDAIKARRRVTPAELREEQLMLAIARVHHENYSVYGARKVWLTLNREGIPVARCTVERLMKVLGLRGAHRGRTVRTTQSDPAAVRPADLVERNFNPSRPDALWVADFSYVPTWAGFVYVAFVIDAFGRRILGWRAASSMRTELVLDALEMAIWTRACGGVADLTGLVHHTDAGSQGGFNRWSQHLDQEVCGWEGQGAGLRLRRGGRRCGLRGVRRLLGVSIGSGSGRRSLGVQPARTPVSKPACRQPLELGGFVRLAACHPRTSGPIRAVTCRSWSARRSRSVVRTDTGCGRLPDISAGIRRRSLVSCAATRRPAAGGWSIGR